MFFLLLFLAPVASFIQSLVSPPLSPLSKLWLKVAMLCIPRIPCCHSAYIPLGQLWQQSHHYPVSPFLTSFLPQHVSCFYSFSLLMSQSSSSCRLKLQEVSLQFSSHYTPFHSYLALLLYITKEHVVPEHVTTS